MEYRNQRDTGAAGASRSSTRQIVLGVVLAVLAVGYGAYALLGGHNTKDQNKVPNDQNNVTNDYLTFMQAVAKADVIADPLQRCLSYPDLPGTHWDEATTRAYCEFRNHKTIQLAEIEDLLKQGKAGEVDRAFQGYLDTQQRDHSQPGLLDAAFYSARFGDADDHVRQVIGMWKQQSPDSAFALAASGVQYVDQAQVARGNGWGRDLNGRQVYGMQDYLDLAFKDFERAISLNSHITAMYPNMIHAAGLEENGNYMYHAAQQGLKEDPVNFDIFKLIMDHAQPKWGNRFGGVEAVRLKVQSLADKNPLLHMLVQRPAVYLATCDDACGFPQAKINQLVAQAADKNLNSADLKDLAEEVYDSNRLLAIEFYSEALRFSPSDPDALHWRAQEMIELGDRAGAVAAYAAVSDRFPDNTALATQLGDIYVQVGGVQQAEATLLAVLQRDPHNYQAMGSLGDLYNHAGHQPEKAEALADTMISEHPDRAAGYIVRSCNQMDHNLPGVYDTIHYFIDHFGDDPQWKEQTAEMRGYLLKHPENTGA